MVRKQYNIVFYGEIVEGYSVEDVRHNLASQFSLDSETREQLFAGKAVVIREHVDYMATSTLQTNCELQGAICHVELARVDTRYDSIDASKLYNIEFRGKITIGRRIGDVQDKLCALLKTDRQTIEGLFSGKRIVIKKDIDYQTALNIEAGFEQVGAICRITASDKSLSQNKALRQKIFLPTNLDMMICPKCGIRQPVSPTCMQCGVVVGKFVKKKRTVVKREKPQKTYEFERPEKREAEALGGEYEDDEELYEDVEENEEEVVEKEEIGPKEIPIWQIGLVGNVILTLLVTLFGISFYRMMVTFSLKPEIYSVDVEFKNIFALLLSNVQIVGFIGPLVPLVMFFRRSFYTHKERGLHYKFWAALLIVFGATLMIDVFVTLFGGFPFVGAFTLKAFGFSAIAYLIGFGVFLVTKGKELLTLPETEETEAFEDEDFSDNDETDSDNSAIS